MASSAVRPLWSVFRCSKRAHRQISPEGRHMSRSPVLIMRRILRDDLDRTKAEALYATAGRAGKHKRYHAPPKRVELNELRTKAQNLRRKTGSNCMVALPANRRPYCAGRQNLRPICIEVQDQRAGENASMVSVFLSGAGGARYYAGGCGECRHATDLCCPHHGIIALPAFAPGLMLGWWLS